MRAGLSLRPSPLFSPVRPFAAHVLDYRSHSRVVEVPRLLIHRLQHLLLPRAASAPPLFKYSLCFLLRTFSRWSSFARCASLGGSWMHKHLHACPHLHALSASFGIQPIMHSIDFEYGKVKILVFHRMFSLFFFFPSICLSSKHYKNTKD